MSIYSVHGPPQSADDLLGLLQRGPGGLPPGEEGAQDDLLLRAEGEGGRGRLPDDPTVVGLQDL